jgi:hypothetical protein
MTTEEIEEHREKLYNNIQDGDGKKEYLRAEYRIGYAIENISSVHSIEQEQIEKIVDVSTEKGEIQDPTKKDLVPHMEGENDQFEL